MMEGKTEYQDVFDVMMRAIAWVSVNGIIARAVFYAAGCLKTL